MPPNERLRSALVRSGHTAASLAERAGIDPKTVERWLNTGRRPHRRNAHAVADVLGMEVRHLWPSPITRPKHADGPGEDLVAVHRRRSDVPIETWRTMFAGAEESIDIMVYAALFLHEQIADWNDLLRARAERGVHIRVLIGDPECDAVHVRGGEERFGHGIESRCRLARLHYQPLSRTAGITVAQHSTTLYNSVYRADDQMYVNTHLYGVNAYGNPLLHLRRESEGGLFDAYTASVDAVWRTSQPLKE